LRPRHRSPCLRARVHLASVEEKRAAALDESWSWSSAWQYFKRPANITRPACDGPELPAGHTIHERSRSCPSRPSEIPAGLAREHTSTPPPPVEICTKDTATGFAPRQIGPDVVWVAATKKVRRLNQTKSRATPPGNIFFFNGTRVLPIRLTPVFETLDRTVNLRAVDARESSRRPCPRHPGWSSWPNTDLPAPAKSELVTMGYRPRGGLAASPHPG